MVKEVFCLDWKWCDEEGITAWSCEDHSTVSATALLVVHSPMKCLGRSAIESTGDVGG